MTRKCWELLKKILDLSRSNLLSLWEFFGLDPFKNSGRRNIYIDVNFLMHHKSQYAKVYTECNIL